MKVQSKELNALACAMLVLNSFCWTTEIIKPEQRVEAKNLVPVFLLPYEENGRGETRLNTSGERWGEVSGVITNFKKHKCVWMDKMESYLTIFMKAMLRVITQEWTNSVEKAPVKLLRCVSK